MLEPMEHMMFTVSDDAAHVREPIDDEGPEVGDKSFPDASPFGSADSDALLFMPIAYHRLCGRVAIVLSSGAELPAKK